MVRENDVYHPSCVNVVYFCWQNENTHSVRVVTKWWWKGVSVGEEELTNNYKKLVFVPQMGQGIMQNTVGESPGISFFWNWLWTLSWDAHFCFSLTRCFFSTAGWCQQRKMAGKTHPVDASRNPDSSWVDAQEGLLSLIAQRATCEHEMCILPIGGRCL